ncbi:DUF4352 domain-containing protein [Dermatophilaceae bacterium Soc4.6]
MTNTPSNPQNAAPGWYPQPDGQQRYWDGRQWTEHLAPGSVGNAPMAPMAAVGPVPLLPSEVRSRKWYAKKRVLIPVGAIILIGAFSQIGGKNESPATPAAASKTSTAKATSGGSKAAPVAPSVEETKDAPKIGSPVRDGKFEFVVTGIKCGIAKVGNQYLNKAAQGQFCAVSMTVKNIGDEAQSIFANAQVAFDGADHKFSADSEAGIYADDSKLLYQEINPGNSVKGNVYFDVPQGTKLAKLELHDSAFSGGVEISLG